MISKYLGLRLRLIAAVCSFPVAGLAQQAAAAGASTSTITNGTVVPKLVNYSGTLTNLNGKPLTSLSSSGYLGVLPAEIKKRGPDIGPDPWD